MYNPDYNKDLDDRPSDEEVFYLSKENFRDDIDLPRRIYQETQESEPDRDHCSLPRGKLNGDIDVLDSQDGRDELSRRLLDSLDQQEQEIKDLDTKLWSLREEVREYFSNLEEKLSCFEKKMDLVVNLVSSWCNHRRDDRRCKGFCTKHVRTDRCLCRGLREPHRCCGRISGVCDC